MIDFSVRTSAAIPPLAAIFSLQFAANSAARRCRELALNRLKTHDNFSRSGRDFPPLQANFPATAESTSSRNNVQERG